MCVSQWSVRERERVCEVRERESVWCGVCARERERASECVCVPRERVCVAVVCV